MDKNNKKYQINKDLNRYINKAVFKPIVTRLNPILKDRNCNINDLEKIEIPDKFNELKFFINNEHNKKVFK